VAIGISLGRLAFRSNTRLSDPKLTDQRVDNKHDTKDTEGLDLHRPVKVGRDVGPLQKQNPRNEESGASVEQAGSPEEGTRPEAGRQAADPGQDEQREEADSISPGVTRRYPDGEPAVDDESHHMVPG